MLTINRIIQFTELLKLLNFCWIALLITGHQTCHQFLSDSFVSNIIHRCVAAH